MLHPDWQPPDHVTLTSAVSMPLPSEQQATLTQGCKDDSTAYNSSMLDIYSNLTPHKQVSLTRACTGDSPAYINYMLDSYRMVTACGLPNFGGACLPLPSNVDFHVGQLLPGRSRGATIFEVWIPCRCFQNISNTLPCPIVNY